MPSKKPKIQAYVSDRLYQSVQSWKAENGIEGDSEAIERLLSIALDLPSDRDISSEALREISHRLDEVERRLGKSKAAIARLPLLSQSLQQRASAKTS
jgi:hypothetical protein